MSLLGHLTFIFLTTFIKVIEGGDFCLNWWKGQTSYCEYGCCREGVLVKCCNPTGIIAGATIGAIVVVVVIIITVTCCAKKSKGHSGGVLNPGTGTLAAVPHPADYGQMAGQLDGMYQTQPPYGNAYPPPPAYYSVAVYSPPPTYSSSIDNTELAICPTATTSHPA